MVDKVLRYVIPCAYDLLPPAMASPEATAMLLAIGLQESRFLERRQLGPGPARGFWQFEESGVAGVLEHPKTQVAIAAALRTLRYDHTLDARDVHLWLEHNDVLACCFARCLLWSSAKGLPRVDESIRGWDLYTATWRPGKPKRNTWVSLYSEAWDRVTAGGAVPQPVKV